jgi:protein-S-isoprenylcysteine O-methyltransferase Ste14
MDLRSFVGLCWLIFLTYWFVSAIGVKKNIRRRSWRWKTGVRILLIAVILAAARLPATKEFLEGGPSPATIHSVEGIAGLIVCMTGFAVCVWARRHLGKNWGMPMSFKEGHELVTTGPYRYVRHPIYGGILLAFLGTALINGPLWMVVFAALAIYYGYSARTEENLMRRQFPEQYKRYKQRTKAIVPFVI